MTQQNSNDKKYTKYKLAQWPKLCLAQDTSIEFKRWTGAEEIELAKALDEHASLYARHPMRYFSILLQHMCTKIAGVQMWRKQGGVYEPTMDFLDRSAHISTLESSDVQVAIVLLRIQALGKKYKIHLNIGGEEVHQTMDLTTMDIFIPVDEDATLREYKLSSPTEFRGTMVNSFIMGPVPWSAYEQSESDKPRVSQLLTVAQSIRYVPDFVDPQLGKLPCIIEDLNQLTKVDLSRLEMLDADPGVKFGLEVGYTDEKVVNGKLQKIRGTVDLWMPAFFQASSLPEA